MRRDRRHPLTGTRTTRLKVLLVAVVLLGALGIRLGYIAAERYHAINDAGTYNRMASMIANYGDYHTGDKPKSGAGGSRGPTAYFPPAFPYLLAAADLVDGHAAGGKTAVPPERIEMAVLGTISVAFVGLVALEAFGEGAAWAALVVAAFYPVMIELSGTLVAENLVVTLELAAAWTALRARRARSGGRAYLWIAATGVLTGLAALTHENAILYVIPFGIGAWGVARAGPAGRAGPAERAGPGSDRRHARLRALGAPLLLIVCTCLMIAPWTIRNAVELHAFVPIADETGITLAGTYNPASANDPQVPYKWHLFSHVRSLRHFARESNRDTEVQLSDRLQTAALDYIKAHPLAPIEAGFDNTLRMFEIEGTYAWHASARAIGLKTTIAGEAILGFWIVCLVAIAGAFTRRARRAPWWLWLMPILWWLSIVPINVETPRFREPIDPFLILLAACAITTALERLGLGGAPVRRRRRAPELAGDDTQLVQMVQRLA
ncbi:MAG TPA: glycosyltransferase family 39 protein [Solirubrobacteraceae bacterium]|jgi:4-amino-4-deoxy-L-arabinose transferase-like glycosyltransferase|nr:glycosyltransferase family 39 protein [Solirubrobacteraceae bacterium]